MAFKQAEQIGIGNVFIKTAILKDDVAEAIWNLSEGLTEIRYSSVSYDYINDLVKIRGTEVGELIKNIPSETFYDLANLTEGDFLVRHTGIESRWGRVYPYYYYKTMTGSILPFNTGGYPLYYSTTSYTAYNYMCFLFDDETKRALFIVLRTEGDTNTSCNVAVSKVITDYLSEQATGKSLYDLFRNSIIVYEPDPWGDIKSDIGGGNGKLDITSDIITVPTNQLSLSDTGFIQLFTPTLAQTQDLSRYMWNADFLENILKLWNDPVDILISFLRLPFAIPVAGTKKVQAGNITTTIYMNYPESQFVTIDCGTYHVDPFYNAYLDYEPYTKCEIYLPYIGTKPLSTDDIMNKDVNVKYTVDIMTGICVANIFCDGSLFYTFSGNCGSTVPISGQNFDALIQNTTNIALAGFSGELFSPSGASTLASAVMSSKPFISKSGNVSSNAGMFTPQKPYLTFTVPNICLPKNQNLLKGYPILSTTKLNALKGYTEIDTIRLDNCSATESEKSELLSILKGGIII